MQWLKFLFCQQTFTSSWAKEKIFQNFYIYKLLKDIPFKEIAAILAATMMKSSGGDKAKK